MKAFKHNSNWLQEILKLFYKRLFIYISSIKIFKLMKLKKHKWKLLYQNKYASEATRALHSSTSTPRNKSNVEENPIHFIYHQLQIVLKMQQDDGA